MMPKVLIMLAFLAPALMPFAPVAAAAGPALPDLSVGPGDIHFSVFDEEPDLVSQELGFLTIGVMVRNAGPGASNGANVTFFDNGLFLALVPVPGNLSGSGMGNETRVEFTWYIADTPSGNHTIRVEASDPAGDADLADNAAERTVTIHGRAPVVAVKFDTASRVATVTATTPGLVTFTGSVITDHNPGPVEINLAASADIGWACRLNRTSLVVTDYLAHGFCVTVTIPPAARNSEFARLRVSARATADGMSAYAETSAIISVSPYFCLTATADRTKATVGPGENAEFMLELRNSGNAVDSYSIDIGNQVALAEKRWSVRSSTDSIPKLAPDSRRTFTIELVPYDDWTPYKDGSVRVDVRITSQNAKDFQSEIYTIVSLTVEQKGFYMPSVGLIGLVALLAVVVSAVAARSLRRRKKKKTVADYNRELHLDD